MSRTFAIWAAAAGAAAAALATPSQAAEADLQRLEALQRQVESLAKELAALKAAQPQPAPAPAPAAVTATLANGRLAFSTADGKFSANLRAIVMLDAGKYVQASRLGASVIGRDLNEGTNFRRARLGLEGKVFGDFDYTLVYEFGGSGGEDPGRLYEASVTYGANRPVRWKVGAFEPNIGLAAATSTSHMPLMERPSPAEIGRNVAGGDSRVAVQATASGQTGGKSAGLRWLASAAATGNTITSMGSGGAYPAHPLDEQTAVIARVAVAPFRGQTQAHLGVNAQYVIQPNDAGAAATPRYGVQFRDRPELRLDATRLIDTGAIDADHVTVFGVEAALAHGPGLIEAEAFQYRLDRRRGATPLPSPNFSGWYVQGSWVLTGEARTYKAVDGAFQAPKPKHNFDGAGHWGALELAARWSDTDLDYRAGTAGLATPAGGVRGGRQRIGTLGVNWYLNPVIRLMADYQHVNVDRLNAAGAEIGQTYDAIAVRAQFAY